RPDGGRDARRDARSPGSAPGGDAPLRPRVLVDPALARARARRAPAPRLRRRGRGYLAARAGPTGPASGRRPAWSGGPSPGETVTSIAASVPPVSSPRA